MKKFEWWDVIHEVGYVCGILSSFNDRKKLEYVRDWCQYRIDNDFSPTTLEELSPVPSNNVKQRIACVACNGFHEGMPCPIYTSTCKGA